jgi:ABC-type nitrate/sulfonate/bicarbonate transport system permease component
MARRRVVYVSLEILVPVLIVAAWWWTSSNSTSPYFPPLRDIIQAFRDNWLFRHVPTDAGPSLSRMGAGYGIAIVVGISLGMLLGLIPLLSRALGPPLEFLRAIPPPALIPVAILVLGIGNTMKVFVIVAGCIWPILLNTIDGVRGVDPTMLEMSRSYGVSRTREWSRILLPAALPQIFSGLRAALSIALILMVISEMIASTNGIGNFVLDAQRTFAIPEMWSGIILLGVLGYTLNALLMLVEQRVLRWHRGFRSSQLAAIAEPR